MKETDDIDKYRRVLNYFTNDDGSEEFSTGSGKFDFINEFRSLFTKKRNFKRILDG